MLNYVFRSPMTLWSILTAVGGYAFLVILTEVGGTDSQLVTFVKLVVLALGLTLTVFGVFFDVAPPFVTKREVEWSNRNASVRYSSPVTFEEEDFMPPVLSRVVAHRDDGGLRHRLRSHELWALRA